MTAPTPVPDLPIPAPKLLIQWNGLVVVGKPGIDYSAYNHKFDGVVLGWQFAKMTDEELIAGAAALSKSISAQEKWLEAVKEILKDRNKASVPLAGDTAEVKGAAGWVGTISHRERTGLDSELIKTTYGDAWYAKHCKTTDYYEIRFKKAT